MKRRDIDRFVYHVAKWAAEAMKGDFRVIRFTSTPVFSIYDLKDEQKFHKHWTSFPQSGRQNVYVFTFN